MEVKANGVTGLIRDVFKTKEREIQQKYHQKHEELLNKIKKTPEYQELQKKMDDLEKQQEKVRKERDKLTAHLGHAWEFDKLAQERLNSEFIKVRIAVMGSEIEEVKKAIEVFAKKEYWEGQNPPYLRKESPNVGSLFFGSFGLSKQYGARGGGTRRDIIEIQITSVIGNEYEAYLTPEQDCELREIEDSRYASKSYEEGEEIVSYRGKDFDRMKKTAELVLRSREFKDGIRKKIEKGEIEKENFSDNMALYMGIADEDLRTIQKEFSRQSEENISNG